VAGVQNIHLLKELLVTVAGDNFELKVFHGNQAKIQPKSSDKYTAIIKALAEKHNEFHKYQPKADRSFRTVLRGLHYSTVIRDIKSEIENLGHAVVNIFNIKQSRTNIPLSLFFVDLKPSANNKDIYQIETLHYTKVKFEPPRPKRTIPQCSKC
jgi:PAX-interacting protein 1